MYSLKLTRYLYNFEEVKLKYYISVFSKKDLNECYFWIYEIYFSDLKEYTIDIILELYYEYYAVLNQNVERKIKEIINLEEDIELIPAKLSKLLFNLNFNYDVFSVIQLIKNIKNDNKLINTLNKLVNFNKKIRITEYLKHFDTKYHHLFSNIYKMNYLYICISLSLFIFNFEKYDNNPIVLREVDELIDLYNNLIKFKKNIVKNNLIYYFSSINLNCDVNKETNKIQNENNKYNEIIYKIIILVFQIYYSLLNKSSDIKENLKDIKSELYSLNIKEIKYIFSLNNEDTNFRKERIYNILKKRRLYFIHQNNYSILGSFNLLRFCNEFKEQDDYISHTLSNWEYYCYETPIWRERFKKYNAIKNIEIKRIIFENDIDDKNYEIFYEKYGYELDEQSSLVYDLYYIDKCGYDSWFNFLSELSIDERKNNKYGVSKDISNKDLDNIKSNSKSNVKISINENSYNINVCEGINYVNEYYKYINENKDNIELNSIENNNNNILNIDVDTNIVNRNINNIFTEIKFKHHIDYNFELFC